MVNLLPLHLTSVNQVSSGMSNEPKNRIKVLPGNRGEARKTDVPEMASKPAKFANGVGWNDVIRGDGEVDARVATIVAHSEVTHPTTPTTTETRATKLISEKKC